MLPLERFAYEILYKGHFLQELPWSLTKDWERLMHECGLIYRKGKNIDDLRNAFWGFGAPHTNFTDHMEWAMERADKVLTINWPQLLKRR